MRGHTHLVVPDEGGDGAPRVTLPPPVAHQLVQAHGAGQVLKREFRQDCNVRYETFIKTNLEYISVAIVHIHGLKSRGHHLKD